MLINNTPGRAFAPSFGQRVQGILGQLVGAEPGDREGLSRGLLSFGANMLRAGDPRVSQSVFGSLGQAIPATQQQMQGFYQQQALDDRYEDLAGLPPQIQQAIVAERERTIQAAPGASLYRDGEIIATAPFPTTPEEAAELLGGDGLFRSIGGELGIRTVEDYRNASDETLREFARRYTEEQQRTAAAGVQAPEAQGVVEGALRAGIEGAFEASEGAAGRLQEAERALELIAQGVETGPGSRPLLTAKSFVQRQFGVDLEGVDDAAELERIFTSKALEALQAFKGSTSEFELRKAEDAAASFGRDTEANRRYFDMLAQLARHQMAMRAELVQAAQQARAEGGELSVYAADEIIRRYREMSVFGDTGGSSGNSYDEFR